jgi:hypothetical protein
MSFYGKQGEEHGYKPKERPYQNKNLESPYVAKTTNMRATKFSSFGNNIMQNDQEIKKIERLNSRENPLASPYIGSSYKPTVKHSTFEGVQSRKPSQFASQFSSGSYQDDAPSFGGRY